MARTCISASQQQEPRLHTHLRPLSCPHDNKRRGAWARAADQILFEGRELSIRRQRLARGDLREHERIPARRAHSTVQSNNASASAKARRVLGSDHAVSSGQRRKTKPKSVVCTRGYGIGCAVGSAGACTRCTRPSGPPRRCWRSAPSRRPVPHRSAFCSDDLSTLGTLISAPRRWQVVAGRT